MSLDRSRSRSPMDRKIRTQRYSYRDAPYKRDSRRGFSQNSLCKNCKRPGHFARECPNVAICHNCGLPGHIASECSTKSLCWNCREPGHMAGNCPNEGICHTCGKTGHRARDCSAPQLPPGDLRLCNNCFKQGHMAADCTNDKACKNCRKTGHLARDCQNEPVCNMCNISGHVARDCPKANMLEERCGGVGFRDIVCRNCQQVGHMSRDCMSMTICHNCGGRGHLAFECPSGRLMDRFPRSTHYLTPSNREFSDICSDVATTTNETEGELSYLKEFNEPITHSENEDITAKTKIEGTSALSIMLGYFNARIVYPPRNKPSSYPPSCLMMDYIVHHINSVLVDNFYFKRTAPGYHPYVLQLYFAILFWIQCMRASLSVSELEPEYHQFLIYFLATHSLETLAIPGPLMPLFKTLCASQPEFSSYGKVYPRLPSKPGPAHRSSFIRHETESFFLPNVPGIFALLEHLNSVINAEDPLYPKKGKHVPVTETAAGATIFGHHSFPALEDRSGHESWSLVSPGLQYTPVKPIKD